MTTRAKCSHFWLIESPNGLFSQGICKLCGSIKEFSNVLHCYRIECSKRGAKHKLLALLKDGKI